MKSYLVDTSVIVHNPHFLNDFKNAKITITLDVLNELDKHKTKPNETGRNARVFIRMLDEIIGHQSLTDGINCGNNCLLFIDGNNYSSDKFGDKTYCDNKLLQAAEGKDMILLSRDISLRLKARAIGIKAENYSKTAQSDDLYMGHRTVVNEEIGTILKENKIVGCEDFEEFKNLYPNECVNVVNEEGKTISLGRKIGNLVQLIKSSRPWGLGAKNVEQTFAIELLNSDLPLVTINGNAGTGKSLITLACGLHQVISNKKYDKLMVYKPLQSLGPEIGFVPGSIDEKLTPTHMSTLDSMSFLLSSTPKQNTKNKKHQTTSWKDQLSQYADQISFEAIVYLRGRNIANSFVFIDEGQNNTHEISKAIISRISHGSKIVICGDITQIDAKDLDATNNGLTSVIQAFKESDLAGHITLTQCERSPLADAAAKLL